ncbi:MAG: glycosyltransferase, partial [Opitutaceae bacterium]
MNILFVNYGDFTTNSLNHIAGFANALRQRGYACVVAVPTGRSTFEVLTRPRFTPATYEELLAQPNLFPDGGPADLIHAWTPREAVRRFVLAYQHRARARLVVHLEDNEEHLLAAWAGRPFESLRGQLDAERADTLKDGLSHPVRYRNLLRLADGVTVIIDPLRRFVPAGPPVQTLPPGVDFSNYRPQPADPALRRELDLRAEEKVIVFPGSITFANQAEIRDLYLAVRLLNERGTPTRLLRAGFTLPDFEKELGFDPRGCVRELGFVRNAEVPRLLALADVLVQPGRAGAFNDYRLPSKLPEFLAMGKPVVLPGTNLAAQMQDGRDALFLRTGSPEEIADACQRIFADGALAARLSEGAVAFARAHFDLTANAVALAGFYDAIMAVAPRADWSGLTAAPSADVPLLARQLHRELAAWRDPLPPESQSTATGLAALADDLALLCRQLEADAAAAPAQAVLTHLEEERAEAHRAADAARLQVANLKQAQVTLESDLAQTLYRLTETRARALALGENSLKELARLRDLLREAVRQREDRIFQREEKIRQMQASFSWKLTAPLRFFRRRLIDPLRRRPAAAPPSAPAYDFSVVPEVQLAFRPSDFQVSPPEFRYSVDYPTAWTFPPRTVVIRGWCMSLRDRPLQEVRAVISGRILPGVYGHKRMDVLASFKEHARAEYCGFRIEVELIQGDTALALEVGDDRGQWHRFFETPLCVDQDSGQLELSNYEDWIKVYDHHTPESLRTLASHVGRFSSQPLISIVMPVFNTPQKWLAKAVESAIAQAYPNWQLCIADDASTQPHVRPLLEQYAAADARIKVVFRARNGHISAASNSALELAT